MLVLLLACGSGTVSTSTSPTEVPTDPTVPTVPTDTGNPPPDDTAQPSPVCDVTSFSVRCPYQTLQVQGQLGAQRDVHFAVPPGDPPADGWPVAFLFQGSFYSGELFFHGDAGDPFGGLHQARLTSLLLDAGYAVIAPETKLDGNLYWDTNILPWSLAWSGCPDDVVMQGILAHIDAGSFGHLDRTDFVATGISSGGYMSSRMAVSYAGRFRALAIQSASYATCGGSLCSVPDLPSDHPPTLFLHGANDVIVPIGTTQGYRNKLDEQGTPNQMIRDENVGHAWFEGGPEAVVAWFDQYR